MAIDAFGGHVDHILGDNQETRNIQHDDIIKEGFLKQYKVKDTLMGGALKVWKSIYMIISKDKLVVYENESDAFDPHIRPSITLCTDHVLKLGTIALDDQSKSKKYDLIDFDHFNAFEVDAGINYTTGDDQIYAFRARDIAEAKSWMEAICHSNDDNLVIVEGFKVLTRKDKETEKETQQEIVIYKSVKKEKDTHSPPTANEITKEKEQRNHENTPKASHGKGRGQGRGTGLGGRGLGRGAGLGRGHKTTPVK